MDYIWSTASRYIRNVEKLKSPKEDNQDGEAQNIKEGHGVEYK